MEKSEERTISEYLRTQKSYYEKVKSGEKPFWDFVVLTASNKNQKSYYELEISSRKKSNSIPRTNYLVVADVGDMRIGSGGATLNVFSEIKKISKRPISDLKILIIHSGGDSKRIPQYSVCGKIFSPVQKSLENDDSSTLFDEFLISLAPLVGNIENGAVMVSGDVYLAFDSEKINLSGLDAATISIKEKAEIGKNHGVFLSNENGILKKFLHKQTLKTLKESNAIDPNGDVDIDTGTVFFSGEIVSSLLQLLDGEEYKKYINEKTRLSLYADLIFPFAIDSTLESYMLEAPENCFCDELTYCRKKIWNVLNEFKLSVIKTSPSRFIHFGTTKELIHNIIKNISDYSHLGWKKNINSNIESRDYCTNSSLIFDSSVGKDAYIENSSLKNCKVGDQAVISNLSAKEKTFPEKFAFSQIKTKTNHFITRVYPIDSNPKDTLDLLNIINYYGIEEKNIYDDEIKSLWKAKLFPAETSSEKSIESALLLIKILSKKATKDEAKNYFELPRFSLFSSVAEAKVSKKTKHDLFFDLISIKVDYENIESFLKTTNENFETEILTLLKEKDSETKYRAYLVLSKYYKRKDLEDLCFEEIQHTVKYEDKKEEKTFHPNSESFCELPVRANFAGGWSDTPPYCLENGGEVLNAAFLLNGELPIKTKIVRLNDKKIILESKDLEEKIEIKNIEELLDCKKINDAFSLPKAALQISGIVNASDKSLENIFDRLSGFGFHLITDASVIPRGSGLGTSSILSGACLTAIYDFVSENKTELEISKNVLESEQLMSTGGGWQDQIGGIFPGIKYIKTNSGKQEFEIEQITLGENIKNAFEEKYLLIYTGQKRLAKNLLRSIMKKYILNEKNTVETIKKIKSMPKYFYEAIKNDDYVELKNLFNEHWKLSSKLDSGFTNPKIDNILDMMKDYIDAKMMCGAGGGGFIQVFLKENIEISELENFIKNNLKDFGVEIYRPTLWEKH